MAAPNNQVTGTSDKNFCFGQEQAMEIQNDSLGKI